MLEKDIEKKVCDHAKKKGWLVYKFTSPQRRSVPDRMFITNGGMVFFIEFKAEGKKPTEGQVRELQRIHDHRVAAYVVDNVPDGVQLLDDLEAATEKKVEEEPKSVIITL